MASRLPIPAPPRTPTPPTPIAEDPDHGLGIDGVSRTVRSTVTYDPNTLSPMTDRFPGRFGSMTSPMGSSTSTASPALSIGDGTMGPPPGAGGRNPFNFQTQTIKDTPAITKSVRLCNWVPIDVKC